MTTITKLGKYLIRRELGQGAMGIVYEGFDPIIERTVAIKTILPGRLNAADGADILARFKREAQSAGRLNHPGIVAIYDYGEVVPENDNTVVPQNSTRVADGTTPANAAGQLVAFIAMEFVKGRELKDYFEDNERFKLTDVARLMGEILAALGHAHANGVVHRDIKPANLIVLEDGRVKIADFGIARVEKSELTQMGTIMGTPSYMSPEQFMGQTVDGRSDLFSCGVVLYQFLTGEKPFTGNTTTIMYKVLREEPIAPSLLNVALPPAFDDVLKKAIAKNPDQRFQSAAEFSTAIQAALSQARPAEPTLAIPTQAAHTVAGSGTAFVRVPEPATSAPAANSAPVTANPPTPQPNKSFAIAMVTASLVVAGLGAYLWTEKNRSPSQQAAGPTAGLNPPDKPMALPAQPAPARSSQDPPLENGTLVVSALGLVDPADARFKGDAAAAQAEAQADARRQIVEKVLALYVEKNSLEKNYPLLEQKLLSQSGSFIKSVLHEEPAVSGKHGLIESQTRAIVNIKDVQKSLNQLSREERIDFIRNNGDPKVAVSMTVTNADTAQAMPATRSLLAENVVKERVKSFGFRVWSNDGEAGPSAKNADFLIQGDAKIKQLSMKLPASGLIVTKSALTSWTVKAIDKASGEEIYINTVLPKGQSWASEDQALADIGKLMGEEFSKDFFLQHFSSGVQPTRLNIAGLPGPATARLVLHELRGVRQVLDAQMLDEKGVYTLQLAQGSAGDIVQDAIVRPLNAKLGQSCFSFAGAGNGEVSLNFASACSVAAVAGKFETSPPAGVLTAPARRSVPLLKNAPVKTMI